MTLTPRDYVRRSGVLIGYGRYAANGALPLAADIKEIGHIEGDVQINDQRNMVTIKEFSSDRTSFDMQFADGRTGSVAFTLNMVPADLGFIALETDYEASEDGFLYIRAYNEAGVPTGREWKLNVQITQFNTTLKREGVATVAANFAISGKADALPTPSFVTP